MDLFDGAWSAMSTPLTFDGRVDADALEKLVEHQLRLGIKGLFLGGTAGEGPFLSDTERLRLVRLTVRFAKDRLPVAFQITDNSAERMIENLDRYQDEGIDLAVIAPPFFQCDASQPFLLDLYRRVIEASQVPVGIYNRGKFSSVLIEPETLGQILDHPKVVLVKDSASQPDYKAAILSSMTAYMNTAHGKKIVALPCRAHFTTQILARMGFFWNASNEKYVDDFINVLRGFMFFQKDNLER